MVGKGQPTLQANTKCKGTNWELTGTGTWKDTGKELSLKNKLFFYPNLSERMLDLT